MATPIFRFKGFTSDWEQRKLGELVDRVTRKNINLESELPLTISAQHGLIDQNEFFDKRIASKDVSGYYLVYNGEFAYNKSTSNDAPWGAIKRLDRYDKGVLSTLYIVFSIKDKDKTDTDYLSTYYDNTLWHKEIHAIAAEGARNHGLLNIAPADFFETKLFIPSDTKEQREIGSFFKKLDNLITLHQRKCDALKDLKKGLLQKMFPKEGARVPEFRFKGFAGDWEQRKLGEIADIVTGTTPSTKDTSNYDGEFMFVSPVDIQGNRYVDETVTTLTEKGFSTGRRLRGGSSLFVSIGSTIGKVAQLRQEAVSNQQINAVIPFESMNDDFVYTLLENKSDNIKLLSATQAVPIINKTTFSEVEISFPSKLEQERIGNYFTNLDNLIALHQRKCDALKDLKKGMLQKMFV